MVNVSIKTRETYTISFLLSLVVNDTEDIVLITPVSGSSLEVDII